MGEQPNLELIPGGETREQQKRRHAAAIAAMRSRHRWAMARTAGLAVCSAGLMIAGAYVAVEANALVGMLIVLAFVAPFHAMRLEDTVLDQQRELRVLRRVARRVSSGRVVPERDGRWHRVTGLVAGGEPMTPSEYDAVYGTDGNEDA